MNILAIDTSTALLGIGLKTEHAYFEVNQDIGLHHTENLLEEMEILFRKAGIPIKDLDLIVVSKGPGSFTGLRIGMAAAKGIAFGIDIPIVSVPNLDTYARGKQHFNGSVCPVIDARKQRIYTAFYTHGERQSEYLDISPDELHTECGSRGNILITGPFAEELSHIWADSSLPISLDPQYGRPITWELLHFGIKMYKETGPDSPMEGPLYIRPSEAELSLREPFKNIQG